MLIQAAWGFIQHYYLYLLRFRGNNVAFLRSKGVRIGERCLISTSIHNFGSEPWLVEVGNDVSITDDVVFLTHDGSSRLFRSRFPEMNPKYGNRFGTIRIHDNCFIGLRAVLMPGIEIGPNAIVGTASVVTHDVAPNTVVAGNPARVIASLDDYIERYRTKSIHVAAQDRESLRRELSEKLWGEER